MSFSDDEIQQACLDTRAAEDLIKRCRPIFDGLIEQYGLNGNVKEKEIAFIEEGIRRDDYHVLREFKPSKGVFETDVIVTAHSLLYAYFLRSEIFTKKLREMIESKSLLQK